jgi:hypothetical protein
MDEVVEEEDVDEVVEQVDIDEVVEQVTTSGCACCTSTTGKHHSFISTDVYIQIIFIGSKTDEYKVILIGLG